MKSRSDDLIYFRVISFIVKKLVKVTRGCLTPVSDCNFVSILNIKFNSWLILLKENLFTYIWISNLTRVNINLVTEVYYEDIIFSIVLT